MNDPQPDPTTTQEDPMTTDPTAAHHAQILDWLSAALTDSDTTMIYLHQDYDESGKWEIHTDRKVDPAKEATAASQADRDALYNLAGTSPATPAGVDEADMDPAPRSPYAAAFSCQCDDCRELYARMGWKDPVTRTKEAVGEAVDRVLKDLKEHTDAPPAFRREKPLKMKGGGSVKSYLEKRYGQPDPAAWYRNVGYLLPGQKVVNDDGEPFRPTTKDQWDAILARGVEWKTTDYGQKLTATFTGKAAEDLLVALYGFAGEDETGVAYRVDTPEGIRKAMEDLFRTEDDR